MSVTVKPLSDLSTLVSLAKRRGFVFQSSEIYGGLNSCWDYGPLGSQLKKNIKDFWWTQMTSRQDVVGLDAAILMHPRVWKASGHVDAFTDPLVDCKKCKTRFREDKAPKNPQGKVICPSCGSADITEARNFNLMFKTHMGPVDDDGAIVYMRPETAQGIFVNFENVKESMRRKIPFGIAQIGKSFRNEISPGNFTFRMREFEQMEMQYFVKPGSDENWFEYWRDERRKFYTALGLKKENIDWHEHGPKELAHYAKAAFDVYYKFPFGWEELEGIHNRSDYDLKQHQEFSSKNLQYFDEATKEKYLPFVIETAVGADRLALAVMCDAYREETLDAEKNDVRVVMGFHPNLAPVHVCILPLSKKENLTELSQKLVTELSCNFRVQYDDAGSIGKRYRRQDEIGTPYCVTVDFDSLEDGQVTFRHRDKMTQKRVPFENISETLKEFIKSFDSF
jgi:glycyl-tRNA synthetase